MTPAERGAASPPEWRRSFDTVTGPGTLDDLQGRLEALWTDHPEIADEVRTRCTVAAFEVCSNIIEHSAHGRPVHLQVELCLSPARIDIEFTDDGDPPSVDLDAVGFPDDLADRGRGLAIAKAVLDWLSYRREAGRNIWSLSHRRVP